MPGSYSKPAGPRQRCRRDTRGPVGNVAVEEEVLVVVVVGVEVVVVVVIVVLVAINTT